jgi:hypothetical protein
MENTEMPNVYTNWELWLFCPVFGYDLWEQWNEITEFLKWNWKRSGHVISVLLEDENIEEDEEAERGRYNCRVEYTCSLRAIAILSPPSQKESRKRICFCRADGITRRIVSSKHILLCRSTCQINCIFSKFSYKEQEIYICFSSQFLFCSA